MTNKFLRNIKYNFSTQLIIVIIISLLIGITSTKNHSLVYLLSSPNTSEISISIPYKRSEYGYGSDIDQDGQNTRAEKLQLASLVPVEFRTLKKKHVKSGKWFDPYTGLTFRDANDVDIDHLVPLYEVHISGGAYWPKEKKRAFANDLSKNGPLRVVHRWTNRIPKNADDPSEYLPSWVPGRCQYLKDWISIKQKWDLFMDKAEARSIEKQLMACD
ncbi:MAG: hypothetical protein P8H03_06875 [Emcibacteraceae bacterium]|nr:hypothetical protein [Emcibacteraceae bacterium]MDG1857494.1 hypothetical protein [Emcibacteraceae bacterium]